VSSNVHFPRIFDEIVSTAGLSPQAARQAFDAIFEGAWSPVQIAGFLTALRARGETAEVIAAAAAAMRSAMIKVEHGLDRVLDTCGTGGDGSGTVNLSTGAALIAAAAGVPVAKHGNRAVSSRAGSADVLATLGIPLDLGPEHAASILKRAGIVFLLASSHHPAMRHAMPARKELAIRTIFNCLGPLCNPAQATHQIVGAYSDEVRTVMAETLRLLGSRRAWVVRGVDGLDEVSPYGPTRVSELSGGKVSEFEVTPEDFGISRSKGGAADGGTPEENARIIEMVLDGADHPARDAFVLNAAAALVVALELAPKAATDRAREALASGDAKQVLARWRQAATEVRGTA
jgi:anthranilate phosphoribosyltransferase